MENKETQQIWILRSFSDIVKAKAMIFNLLNHGFFFTKNSPTLIITIKSIDLR